MNMQNYFDLGTYHRQITTQSEQALTWFNRGLVWCYAFNQEEAVRCFEKVIEHDDNCAMGYWGLAYAAGPFYNKPWEWYGDQERMRAVRYCHEYAAKAQTLKQYASPVEVALIDALCLKHPVAKTAANTDTNQWMRDYADAMRLVYQEFPDDLDVICLSSEALMNLTPWQLWDLQMGIPADNACTLEAAEILKRGIKINDAKNAALHPGIVHLYVHLYEMSPTPETAITAANRLRDLCPDAGHLIHMASHIDSLCGHWQAAADANSRAIMVDKKYTALRGRDEFYMILVLHNYDFKIWASMFLGQFKESLAAAEGIRSLTEDKILPRDEWFLNSMLEGYFSTRVHVLVRFGRWQDICDEKMPDDPILFPITSIFVVYAKAIAYAALGFLDTARDYQKRFRDMYRDVPEWHSMANNPSRNIIAVAEAMMNGEVEYHAGNHELGFEHLREANQLNDNLDYAEPWPWMHPPRHALGALLLEQGQVDEALIHYEDDLGIGCRLPRCVQHPDNIWALHGYHECLTRLGRDAEAVKIKPRLDELMQNADIQISSSCLCRKN